MLKMILDARLAWQELHLMPRDVSPLLCVLHPPLMPCPSTALPPTTPPAHGSGAFPSGDTQPNVLYPPGCTLWPGALFTALSLLHLIPVINFLTGFFPTVLLTLVSECLSKIKLSSYICVCL